MRTSLVIAGVTAVVLGIVVFAFGGMWVGRATTDFLNCLNGFTSQPTFGFPAACTYAMSAAATWERVEALGGFLSVIGLVVLVLGALLNRERPAPLYSSEYPPPTYTPPPVYAPPQGSQNLPPPLPDVDRSDVQPDGKRTT